MSFINKFKDFMGIGEEDFEDDFEENGQQPEETDDDPFGSFAVQPEYRGGKTEPAENTTAPRRDNKVVNMGIVAAMLIMVKLQEMLRMTVEPLPLLCSLIMVDGLMLHLKKKA